MIIPKCTVKILYRTRDRTHITNEILNRGCTHTRKQNLLTVLVERIFYAGPNRLYLRTAPEV